MDAVGVEAADRHDLLDLGDANLAARRRRQVEVARGLAEQQIAALVGLPALDDRKIRANAALEDIFLAAEFLDLFALGHLRAVARLCVKPGNACAARAHPLGERPLRAKFALNVAGHNFPPDLLATPAHSA